MSSVTRTSSLALVIAFAGGLATTTPAPLTAQAMDGPLDAMASWVAADTATGYEHRTSPALAAALGWTADQWGNVVTTVGTGSPHHIVACALDRPGYAITQIRDDGYLRLHRIGRGSRHPLWDQQFEAQHVRIMTATGPVAGVVARSNGHFAQQHARETAIVTADDLWLDVGAESAAEVAKLGIALLDPVARHLPPWPMPGGVAGPDAGRRVGCAAVATLAAAAKRGAPAGRTTFVLSAQEVTGWVGLSSLVARADRIDRVTILAPGEPARADSDRAAASLANFGTVLQAAGLTAVKWLAPATDQSGSHMEIVRETEAQWLLESAAKAAGVVVAARPSWVAAPARQPLRTGHGEASLNEAAVALTNLADRYAVSGREWSVRRAVLDSLPAWARDRAVVDDIGNIMVEAGPAGPATVFMAHMDEVGHVIESIAPDGTAALTAQGGVVASAWEGQTALVHFDPPGAPSTVTGSGTDVDPRWKTQSMTATAPPPVRGVFRIREKADRKDPGPLHAWFGLDAAGLAAAGVKVGMQVTNYKEAVRLGRTRYAARSLDDRAGTTALVRAVNRIDPDRLPGKVIFTWSVHEEGGLRGANAMARRFAKTTARIYSLDTFVSSDTPLESPHFAYAPLGKGPVLRAIENSSVSPDSERARVAAAAKAAGIPLQIGLTQGGTDGSAFTYWGAPNQGLSWPGRYSHSPGEVLDLRDLDHLVRLVVAVATGR